MKNILIKNIVNFVYLINRNIDECGNGDRSVVISSLEHARDVIRESGRRRQMHNSSFIADLDSLPFSEEGPYCWLSIRGLYRVDIERSSANDVSSISTTHVGFIGIEPNAAVTSP